MVIPFDGLSGLGNAV